MTQSHNPAFFVFNGDADGLISQHLMELSGTAPSLRVTGLKRETALLERLPPLESARVYVFDIGVEANLDALSRLLEKPGVLLWWFDHHEARGLPASPRFKASILNARGVCTAVLVHKALPGSDPRWAAMAAFGDNVPEAGEALLSGLATVAPEEKISLREAGELLNYNAYGEDGNDVLFHPSQVAERLAPFRDPLEFFRESGLFDPLRRRLREDEIQARGLQPGEKRAGGRIYLLPDRPWARRLGATFANRVSRENPGEAVSVLHPLRDGAYRVSIRSPVNRKDGAPMASDLAREFPGGGGRALAAGVNRLEEDEIARFQKRFFEFYR